MSSLISYFSSQYAFLACETSLQSKSRQKLGLWSQTYFWTEVIPTFENRGHSDLLLHFIWLLPLFTHSGYNISKPTAAGQCSTSTISRRATKNRAGLGSSVRGHKYRTDTKTATWGEREECQDVAEGIGKLGALNFSGHRCSWKFQSQTKFFDFPSNQ